MTKDDMQLFKNTIYRESNIIILSTYSKPDHGKIAEQLEFLSKEQLFIVYPRLLRFLADNDGIILTTFLNINKVTVLEDL